MLGLMQDWPLLIHRLIDHAAIQHPRRAVVSRSVEGPIHRTDYATLRTRALQLAKRLTMEGVVEGDRVATLAWNTWRHFEAWYAISGIGAVYHTVNPRLFSEQIAWIMNHAESRLALVDLTFVPLMEQLAEQLPYIRRFVVLTDAANMPETSLRNAVPYETWLAEADADYAWHSVDERTAAGLCYTSGTTGDPKGVLYSHRSNVLHAMTINTADMAALTARDIVMPVVPMFHANGWILPFAAPLAGASLVLPGAKLDGASVHELLESEGVTFSAAVPTIWMMLLQHLRASGGQLSTLNRVGIGGSACPPALIDAYQREYGVRLLHAWGMTEMSPLGTWSFIKPEVAHLEGQALLDLQSTQGLPTFGVEIRITDDAGTALPWDGKVFGRLKVRGPAVTSAYFKAEGAPILDAEGFFDTGDVATIDPNGYMQITDRSKDVIKSGGEWISSIAIENLAVGHPDVAEAAVVAIPHPKWDERPLLLVVPKQGTNPTKASILDYLSDKIAKFWMPDDVLVVESLPHTATGKLLKTKIREMVRDHQVG
ncbi:MAG: AMP-dependent synthetase and ligase [Rhodospirillales bacterium]|nr:AMP-dependent synthetase and ligase [Rhodospirillales bacterium]